MDLLVYFNVRLRHFNTKVLEDLKGKDWLLSLPRIWSDSITWRKL